MKTLFSIVTIGALAIASCSAASEDTPSNKAQKTSVTSSKPSPHPTGRIDIDTSRGALAASRKIMCSLKDGEAITYYWFGKAFSRRMGERDKHMFNVEGMNIRQCTTVSDATRGVGYKLVSREILLYKDPKTNKVLNTWENPWTGEDVEVMHVANDPVNFTSYETGRDGKPASFNGHFLGDGWHQTNTVPLFYPNPLASDFQNEIGGTYHATEMFNFFGNTDDLLDGSKNTAEVAVSWERMSDWLPWMKMGGRDGVVYMHTAGRKVESWDAMPDSMKDEIRNYYPEYVGPPPADDTRKNMTSWKYYKQAKEGKINLPKR